MPDNTNHDRGQGHPSSLESFHHVGADGEPIYSPAQKSVMKRQSKKIAELAEYSEADRLPHDRIDELARARLAEFTSEPEPELEPVAPEPESLPEVAEEKAHTVPA